MGRCFCSIIETAFTSEQITEYRFRAFRALLEIKDTFNSKLNVFSYEISLFSFNSLGNFMAILCDIEKQWLGKYLKDPSLYQENLLV